ncbi:hypothetical protein Y1Q_0016810 [Alligator mississippiensis]|uniref:SCAN box domain-containing protein n=1 Tax=Alligator mississippiensis TaxID=8496 RepID=A0A151P6J6_ALLMI|nr:hypothetical protein Y1Q_0016810 [Alligator mississippiensis]
MQPSGVAQVEVLTQAIQAIGQLLAVQQLQGAHQQEWIQRNAALFRMPRMTKDDDLEAYIEAFERTAIQTRLDRSQWGHQLGALVIDKAQAAYRALSREEAQDYEAVKAAILYQLEISPESCRQAFRARKPKESKRPRGLLQTLRDALQKWLPAGKFDRAGVLDQILLEQFLWDLEEDTQRWVRRHQPRSSEEALRLAEAFSNSEKERGSGQGFRVSRESSVGPPLRSLTPSPSATMQCQKQTAERRKKKKKRGGGKIEKGNTIGRHERKFCSHALPWHSRHHDNLTRLPT